MAQPTTPVASSTPHPDSHATPGTMLYTVASVTGTGTSVDPWLKVTPGGGQPVAIVQVKAAFAANVLAYPGAPKYVLASDAEVTAEATKITTATTAAATALTARQSEVQARADLEKTHV